MPKSEDVTIDTQDVGGCAYRALPLSRLKELKKAAEFGISEHDVDDMCEVLDEMICIREFMLAAPTIKAFKKADPVIGAAIENQNKNSKESVDA